MTVDSRCNIIQDKIILIEGLRGYTWTYHGEESPPPLIRERRSKLRRLVGRISPTLERVPASQNAPYLSIACLTSAHPVACKITGANLVFLGRIQASEADNNRPNLGPAHG